MSDAVLIVPPPDPAADVAVIEAQSSATVEAIEAGAAAEIQLIEARAENPEWQLELQNVIRSQAESSAAEVAALRTDMTAAILMLSERLDQLTPPPPPPEEPAPNPDPGPNENPADRENGSEPKEPEATEAREPEKPERKRAHRWI
jgi:hypothetical protein